jgi:hypothetical protein
MCQMQQHVVATRIIADATLEVARILQHVVWPSWAGSGDDKKPKWRNVPIEDIDEAKRVQVVLVGFWLDCIMCSLLSDCSSSSEG